jgi:hypothetical protein
VNGLDPLLTRKEWTPPHLEISVDIKMASGGFAAAILARSTQPLKEQRGSAKAAWHQLTR